MSQMRPGHSDHMNKAIDMLLDPFQTITHIHTTVRKMNAKQREKTSEHFSVLFPHVSKQKQGKVQTEYS